jgi:hypothetical protein
MRPTMILANQVTNGPLAKSRQSLRFVAALVMLLGPVLAMTGLPATANAAEPARPVPSETAPAPAQTARTLPVGNPGSEAQTYEAREAQAKSLEQFKGGDTVVIAGSTVVLILLIVLLIVLI